MNYVIHGKVIKVIRDTEFFLKKRKKKKSDNIVANDTKI